MAALGLVLPVNVWSCREAVSVGCSQAVGPLLSRAGSYQGQANVLKEWGRLIRSVVTPPFGTGGGD